MTPFERATVAAFLARREHGAWSQEYRSALEDMERHRHAPPLAPRTPQRCNWCGKVNGHAAGCHRGPDKATPP